MYTGQWDAAAYFRDLTARNRLARKEGFEFVEISGLKGLSDLLAEARTSANIIAVDDTSEGYTQIVNTPFRRAVKCVYISMRHRPLDMDARKECLAIEAELFRQIASQIIRERTRLQLRHITIDPKITFNEIDTYFAPGSACAFFQIAVDIPMDMVYRPEEWQE